MSIVLKIITVSTVKELAPKTYPICRRQQYVYKGLVRRGY